MRKKTTPEVKIDLDELVANFRTARNKREQIGIEADLHCVAPRAIAEMLDNAGELSGTGLKPRQFSDVYTPVSPAKPRKRGPKPKKKESVEVLKPENPKEEMVIACMKAAKADELTDQTSEDLPAASPSCCQPGRAMDVWAGYTVPEPDRTPSEPAHDDAKAPNGALTVNQYLLMLGKLLMPVLDAELSINGERVTDIFGYEVKVRNDRVYVDVRTTEADA